LKPQTQPPTIHNIAEKKVLDAPDIVIYYPLNTGKEVIAKYEFLSQ
jgi:hypothetical protein